MNDIVSNLRVVDKRIAAACKRSGRLPKDINLVAVTKGTTPEMIISVFNLGIKHFGENAVQEADFKIAELGGIRRQIVWHMIGHLQTNKARQAAALFDIIQSIDSIRLAETLSKRSERVLPVLIQVNVAGEESKGGFRPGQVKQALIDIKNLANLEVKGLMTIAPVSNNPEKVRPVFHELRMLGDSLGLEHLSMGMSDDYEVAIEEGATIVRLGRAIFGERRK